MTRPTLWIPLLAALALLLVDPFPAARAAEEEAGEPVDLEKLADQRAQAAMRYPVRARISRYLTKATELLDEDKPDEARALLDRLPPGRLNPYERALVFRLKAFVAYTAGDLADAIAIFEEILALQVLPIRDESRIRFNIAQLHASLEQWPEVVASMNRFLRYTEEPDPLAYFLLAVAHYQLQEFDEAIASAEKAVDVSPEPQEGWLKLLSALYVQKEDYASAVPVLEELLLRFPKKAYWVQLSLIYGARENYRESLAVQQMAYVQGFLTEDKELRRLARSYLYHNLPYPAAQVLQKGLESGAIEGDSEAYELLANSWIAAREYEKSLPPLQRAAELAKDGNLYVRLGQVRMQREDWHLAADLLQKAIDKGGLKNLGHAELLLGICYYNDERVGKARSSFERASRHEKTRTEAVRWISHIEKEQESAG